MTVKAGLSLDEQYSLLTEVFYTLTLGEMMDASFQMNSERGGYLIQVSAMEFGGGADDLLQVCKDGLHSKHPSGYLEVESQLPYSFVITAGKGVPWDV
jgi:hypothetical protein